MSTIQLGGGILFGDNPLTLTDYSLDVSKCVIHLARNKVNTKPTYGNPRIYGRPGAAQDTIEVVAESEMNDAAGLWTLFLQALVEGSLVYWSAKYKNAPASASNLRFHGSFYVTDLDAGAEVNTAKELSRTYDLVDWYGPVPTDTPTGS